MSNNVLMFCMSMAVLSAGTLPAKRRQTIENDVYTASVQAADGAFTAVSKPTGKPFLTAGKLSGSDGTAQVVELADKIFGKGKCVEIRYANGSRETVALYRGLPFVLFQRTFHNGGAAPLTLNHVPAVSAGVELGKPLGGIRTLGTGGLLPPKDNPGSYHPGIGPHGNNPENNLPFSFLGLTDGNLRITKFGALQYGVPGGKAIVVNEVLPHPVPGAWATIVKGNFLRYNQRVAFPPSTRAKPRDMELVRFVNLVVNGNRINHSPVGVQIGPHVRGALLSNNRFEDVATPYLLAKPAAVKVIDANNIVPNHL